MSELNKALQSSIVTLSISVQFKILRSNRQQIPQSVATNLSNLKQHISLPLFIFPNISKIVYGPFFKRQIPIASWFHTCACHKVPVWFGSREQYPSGHVIPSAEVVASDSSSRVEVQVPPGSSSHLDCAVSAYPPPLLALVYRDPDK